MNTKISTTRRLVESALMIALAVALDEFAVIKFPFGGSVTLFSQLPIILLSYRYGVKWGLFSGFTMSIFEFVFGLKNLSYVTGIKGVIILILADYLIAFTCLGLGGVFKKPVKNQALSLALGSVVVSVLRFICHFVSGVTIWGGYAPEGTPVWKYSLLYNGGYMLPELIITVIGALAVGMLFDLNKPELGRERKKSRAE
ncbi:MAG: energy-coupled thiamine transporter ThiT [Ruminococcaceae bacterium]|nr:energy-coupled thiamine transporter ThiT [Oscillospiraceae bacterium]